MIMVFEVWLGYFLPLDGRKLFFQVLDKLQRGSKVVLLYYDVFVFSVQIFYGHAGVSLIELFDCFEGNLNFMNLFVSVVLQHKITASEYLFLILKDSFVHLFLKTIFHCEAQLLSETIFDIH